MWANVRLALSVGNPLAAANTLAYLNKVSVMRKSVLLMIVRE